MTTNVDIFFKDLSANAAAVDRREKYNSSADRSRAAADHNNDGSQISGTNNKDQKTFSDHLNEQTINNDRDVKDNVKSTTDTKDQSQNKSDDINTAKEQDVQSTNDTAIIAGEVADHKALKNNTVLQDPQSVGSQSKNILAENTVEKQNNINATVPDNKTTEIEITPTKVAETSLDQEQASVSDEAINNKANNLSDNAKNTASSNMPGQENSQPTNVVATSAQNTPKDIVANTQTPESKKDVTDSNSNSNEADQIAKEANNAQPNINIEKGQSKTVNNHDQKIFAENNETPLMNEENKSDTITLSLSKDNDGPLIDNTVAVEQETEHSAVPATAVQNNVQISKDGSLDEKSGQKLGNSPADNSSITNRQDQNNNHDASSNHKSDDGKNNNASNNNNNGAKDTPTIANNNSTQSSQPVNIQNMAKGDITFDATLAGQKTDSLLLQSTSLNGQPNLLTGSILTVQDINVQKPITDLATLMKPQETLNAKMVNDQITVAISQNALKGQHNFNIRLNPAELGQIDVKLEFMADGKVHASMMVENEKTLTMLQRDQAFLGKTLQDSGLNLSQNNLSFSLMKQNSQGNGQNLAYSNSAAKNDIEPDGLLQPINTQEMRMRYSNQAIDISV